MRIICFNLIVLSLAITGSASASKKEKMVGTVIAYDRFNSLMALTSVPNSQDLIFRIERQGKQREHLIHVHYSYWMTNSEDKSRFPVDATNNTTKWQLSLSRNRNCDEPVEEFLRAVDADTHLETNVTFPVWRILPAANDQKLPFGDTLPCYSMQAGDFKPYTP